MNPINKWALLWPVILTLLIPLVAAWFAYPTTHLPPGFGIFPPIQTSPAPGFSLIYFLVVAALAALILLLLLFPKIFGIQGVTPAPASAKQPLPWWCWVGGVV
ncbi:MAG: mechanosensitive ion channel protein MscS, partial [Saccharospirillum sp.]